MEGEVPLAMMLQDNECQMAEWRDINPTDKYINNV